MAVDFGRTVDDYVRHRAGFPEELFDRLSRAGAIAAGQRLLDLGTGTGNLARGFARRGLQVVGLDPSSAMLDQARQLDRAAGLRIAYVAAHAESTGLRAASFDAVSAGQCWHWFERARAAREVRRLLRPRGRVIIAHFDWLPLAGNVVEATERLILEHNSGWRGHGGSGLHAAWLGDLALAGFTALETFSFDQAMRYSHVAWRGRVRASAGIAASLDRAAVARFDAEHEAMLAQDFPADPLLVPHRCWAVVGSSP